MKAKLNIELSLPEEYSKLTELEIRQMIYDEFLTVPHLDHLVAAFEAIADYRPAHIVKYQKDWAKITDVDNMKYSIEIEKTQNES